MHVATRGGGTQYTANGFTRDEAAPGFFGNMKNALCGAL